MSFAVDAAEGEGLRPGAFQASARYDIRRSQEIEVVFERILHLYEPWDNTEDSGHHYSDDRTSFAADLAPSRPLEHYEFMMYAYDRSGDRIAQYRSTRGGVPHHHAHYFKVEPRSD